MKAMKKILKGNGPKLIADCKIVLINTDAAPRPVVRESQPTAISLPRIIVTPPKPTLEPQAEQLIPEQVPGLVAIKRRMRPMLRQQDSFSRIRRLNVASYVRVPPAKVAEPRAMPFTQEELDQFGIAI